jgi:hypothetical protein
MIYSKVQSEASKAKRHKSIAIEYCYRLDDAFFSRYRYRYPVAYLGGWGRSGDHSPLGAGNFFVVGGRAVRQFFIGRLCDRTGRRKERIVTKKRSSKILGSEFLADLVSVLKKGRKIFSPLPPFHVSKYASVGIGNTF